MTKEHFDNSTEFEYSSQGRENLSIYYFHVKGFHSALLSLSVKRRRRSIALFKIQKAKVVCMSERKRDRKGKLC